MNVFATAALFCIAAGLFFVGLEIRKLNQNISTVSAQIELLTNLPQNIKSALNPFSSSTKSEK